MNLLSTFVCVCVCYVCTRMCVAFTTIFFFHFHSLSVYFTVFIGFAVIVVAVFRFVHVGLFVCLLPRVLPASSATSIAPYRYLPLCRSISPEPLRFLRYVLVPLLLLLPHRYALPLSPHTRA